MSEVNMDTNGMIIKTDQISKIYPGDIFALDKVSIEIHKGEFAAISGPSGSGKTTLLNIIGGLDIPDEGKISIDGKDPMGMNDNQLSDFRLNTFGFVFQAFNLIPALNALENVMLPLLPTRRTLDFDLKMKAVELLQIVGLEDRGTHLPSQLSGGEMQRVSIARALINAPKIILADEPTGNLDSKIGQTIIQLLQQLNKDLNTTVILVSHDQEMIRDCHRILRISDGKIK